MSSGRAWSMFAVGIAMVGLIGAFTWRERAQAETTKVEELTKICEHGGMHHRRAAAIRDLAELDSDASRAALGALAESKDDRHTCGFEDPPAFRFPAAQGKAQIHCTATIQVTYSGKCE